MTKLPDDVVEACSLFGQGDLIAGAPVVILADLNRPLTDLAKRAAESFSVDEAGDFEVVDVPCELAIIVSQTCDVRSDTRETIKLAPVLRLSDPDEVQSVTRKAKRRRQIEMVESGRSVHKVMLNGPAGYLYADLESITTIEKTVLLEKTREFGFSDADGYRQFAFRCGHVHDRPAVPDPADRLLTNELRGFLISAQAESPELFAAMQSSIFEESLFLDDWETPTAAQLWFLGKEPIPDNVRAALDQWHARLPPSGGMIVLPNRYESFDSVQADEYRNLRVISHWYLSTDEVDG